MRRRQTELSANLRGVLRSPYGWGKPRKGLPLALASSQMTYPSALQALAAQEAGLMFWLVSLSGCREGQDEHQAVAAAVP